MRKSFSGILFAFLTFYAEMSFCQNKISITGILNAMEEGISDSYYMKDVLEKISVKTKEFYIENDIHTSEQEYAFLLTAASFEVLFEVVRDAALEASTIAEYTSLSRNQLSLLRREIIKEAQSNPFQFARETRCFKQEPDIYYRVKNIIKENIYAALYRDVYCKILAELIEKKDEIPFPRLAKTVYKMAEIESFNSFLLLTKSILRLAYDEAMKFQANAVMANPFFIESFVKEYRHSKFENQIPSLNLYLTPWKCASN